MVRSVFTKVIAACIIIPSLCFLWDIFSPHIHPPRIVGGVASVWEWIAGYWREQQLNDLRSRIIDEKTEIARDEDATEQLLREVASVDPRTAAEADEQINAILTLRYGNLDQRLGQLNDLNREHARDLDYRLLLAREQTARQQWAITKKKIAVERELAYYSNQKRDGVMEKSSRAKVVQTSDSRDCDLDDILGRIVNQFLDAVVKQDLTAARKLCTVALAKELSRERFVEVKQVLPTNRNFEVESGSNGPEFCVYIDGRKWIKLRADDEGRVLVDDILQ